MTRLFLPASAIALAGVLACSACSAQNPTGATTQNPSGTPEASSPHSSNTAPAVPGTIKKPKKVWTNDDVNSLSGPVSVVGDAKNQDKPAPDAKADGQYIANTRKQLQKLQSQLAETDQQLTDLQNFSQGKEPATSGGYEFTKGYNRVPVNQQITNLQGKKKQIESKIDALLDEARKKGVQPGDLR